jgi:Holliday junction resolvase RusA-like endonuclease
MITISIPHEPVPWAAPRLSHGHAYDTRAKIKKKFKEIIQSQYNGPLIAEPVCIRMAFVFTPPKSAAGLKRQMMLDGFIIPTKCDCTNLQKLYEDCLKGIVIKDDRQVAMILSEKCYEEEARVTIIVKKLIEGFNDSPPCKL